MAIMFAKSEVQNCYMLGVLAENRERYPMLGDQEAITTVKNSNRIVFYINTLSPDPEAVIELNLKRPYDDNLYIGWDDEEVFPVGFLGPEYKYCSPEQKIDYLFNKLRGKLILFQPFLKEDSKLSDRIHKNLRIITIEDTTSINSKTVYTPVPNPSISEAVFESSLLNRDAINFVDYNHQMSSPEFVICGDYLYYSEGGWIGDPSQSSTSWIQSKPESVEKILLPKDYHKHIASRASVNLLFFDIDYLMSIRKLESSFLVTIRPEQEIIVNGKKDSIRGSQNSNYNTEEILFLASLREKCLQENLIYDMIDLYNFHVSVKTNAITILGGMSGVGKTELANLYANALGLDKEREILILPISPSFTEPGDILGFLNPSTNLYMPAETKLIDILFHASENTERMHMVIFDEMNLSQIEHWFAPFISLLELKETDRYLSLYSDKTRPHNEAKYPYKIHVGNNIRFIGTVNMDETTKEFSDRLLDRANLVMLNKSSFIQAKQKLLEGLQRQEFERSEVVEASKEFSTTSTYTSWIYTGESWKGLEDEELRLFDELHEILNKVDPQKGVSFRVIDRIARYINNIPVSLDEVPTIKREDAIDIQVRQRILTKIRGTAEQYGRLIGQMIDVNTEEPTDSALYKLFSSEQAQKISHFERTLKEIRKKAREVFLNGYAT